MKKAIIIVLSLILFSIAGYFIFPYIHTKVTQPKIIYIGINGHFMGTYEDNNWNTFMIKDGLLDNSFRVILNEELNSPISYTEYNQNEKLKKDVYIVNEESKEQVFTFDTKNLVIASSFNPIPREVQNIAITEQHKQYIRTLLNDNELTQCTVNVSQVLEAEFDNDETTEYFIIANSSRKEISEENTSIFSDFNFSPDTEIPAKKGVYSIIIMVRNDEIIPICENYVSAGTHPVENVDYSSLLLGLYDLNDDGKMEICIQNTYHNSYETIIYDYVDNVFRPVLYNSSN